MQHQTAVVGFQKRLTNCFRVFEVSCERVARKARKNVEISRRDTLYPRIGLPIKSVLVCTQVSCLLRDRRRAVLFIWCTAETEIKLVRL